MFGGIMTPKSPISFSCGLILSPLQNLKVGKKKSKLLSWKIFVRIGRMGMNSVEMLVFRFFRRPNCYSDSWVKRTYWVELQTNFFTPSIPSQYYLSWTMYFPYYSVPSLTKPIFGLFGQNQSLNIFGIVRGFLKI